MSDGRKTKLKETEIPLPEMPPLPPGETQNAPEEPLTPEEIYLKRRDEVAQQDHAEFSEYLQKKMERERKQQLQTVEWPDKPRPTLNRRNLLTWVAGTAAVGEAVTLGYPLVTGQNAANQAGSAVSMQPPRQPIDP